MRFITDFHIHSHFSIATSKKLIPEYLEYWARLKGIHVIGTGDCIHPGWLSELQEKLEPVDNGLYRLKKKYRLPDSIELKGDHISDDVYFMLTGELSSIYKKSEKVRKVHNLCVFPDFESVIKVQNKLDSIGNIRSDGRPILGLDSKIILEMVLDSSDTSFLIPAHIWTPWFSVLGSKSGFESLEECYEDLTDNIFALETGLSSDPPMNRACSFLDKYKMVSNSDAHSPEKLGREANIFDTDISYRSIYESLKGESGFLGTIEFYPQEGKYHYDGHRKCGICWDPLETEKHRGICPVCGKKVTKGVMYRVAELADRGGKEDIIEKSSNYYITQLPDLLAEIFKQKSSNSKRIMNEYHRLIRTLGSEFHILLFADIEEISRDGNDILAEGIQRLRRGNIIINEGFDGEFGRIRVFDEKEIDTLKGSNLFTSDNIPKSNITGRKSIAFDIDEFKRIKGILADGESSHTEIVKDIKEKRRIILSSEQKKSINYGTGPLLIIAGPGSGKTRILIERIGFLIKEKEIIPENILAITFSNKAAGEIRDRLDKEYSDTVTVSTFHGLGLSILKKHHDKIDRRIDFKISDNSEREIIVGKTLSENKKIKEYIKRIDSYKNGIDELGDVLDIFEAYEQEMRRNNMVDLSDLLYLPVKIFHEFPEVIIEYRNKFKWILVDEFQDINSKQYEFIQHLSGDETQNLFAIGDPDQAIYGFRGSDVQFIEKLKKEYDGIHVINLFKSYRCPGPVLKTAGQVLQKDTYLDGRTLDIKVHIQESDTDKSEADWIAAEIEKLIGGVRSFSMESGMSDGSTEDKNIGFSDFAILCRSSFQFNFIEEALQNHGIAYQTIDNIPFFEKEPYSKVISLLKDFYFGDHSILHDTYDLSELVLDKIPVTEIVEKIMVKEKASLHEIERIKNLCESFGSNYTEFFRSITLRQGADDHDYYSESVSIITLHASKGLEFKTVFIAGCEEGIIPFKLFDNINEEQLKEEERLLYVGMTRTIENLYLSYAKQRLYKGRTLKLQKSSFLERIENNLIKKGKREKKHYNSNDHQLNLFD